MWINVERGVGAEKTWISFLLLYFLGLLNDSFGPLKSIFGSIWPISTQNRRQKLKTPKVKHLSSICGHKFFFLSFSNLNHDTRLKVFCSIVEIVVMPRKIVMGDDWALSGGTPTTQSKSLQSIKHYYGFYSTAKPNTAWQLAF